jgi:glycogen synthase
MGLPGDKSILLLAFTGRLDHQKGADIVLQVGREWRSNVIVESDSWALKF